MEKHYSRIIPFEKILNFRDLGGYKARNGRSIAWRRIFRSGEMHLATKNDINRLTKELKIKTIIDLRGANRVNYTGSGPLKNATTQHFHIPLTLVTDVERKDLQPIFNNMGEVLLYRISYRDYGQNIIKTLEIITDRRNHPLVFHCNAGKDRSGTVSAILLSALGVSDKDIIEDYVLSALDIKEFVERWDNDPATTDIHKNLPHYHQEATPESMTLFLNKFKKEYGSAENYLKDFGAETSLVKRLEKALLV
jgi:protein-tyrosine phosphatase